MRPGLMKPGPESIELVDVKKDRIEMENCQRGFGNSFENKGIEETIETSFVQISHRLCCRY